MDGLSFSASVITVVSLAVQLADSVQKLCEFYGSVKEAPGYIRGIASDLELLSSVLTEIALEAQRVAPDETLSAVLRGCTHRIKNLTALTNDMEPGFASHSLRVRQWTAIKAVLKNEKFGKVQDGVERLKSSLLLAQQSHYGRLSRIRYEDQQQSLMTLTQCFSSLSTQQCSATVTTISNQLSSNSSHTNTLIVEASRVDGNIQNPIHHLAFEVGSKKAVKAITASNARQPDLGASSRADWYRETPEPRTSRKTQTKRVVRKKHSLIQFPFGTIYTSSATYCLQQQDSEVQELYEKKEQYQQESLFTIRPATWLVRLGCSHGLYLGLSNSPTQGWKQSINTFCPVPDDSLIFQFCEEGILSGVRGLFSKGLASIRDTNSEGMTPLHYAASKRHPELCKYLISKGADKSLCTSARTCSMTPARLIVDGLGRDDKAILASSSVIDSLRLFMDDLGFHDSNGDGWDVLRELAFDCAYCEDRGNNIAVPTFAWFIRSSNLDIKANHTGEIWAKMLEFLVTRHGHRPPDATRLLLENIPKEVIDAVSIPTGYTLFQRLVATAGGQWSSEEILSVVFSMRPNLHVIGLDQNYSAQKETLVSLAMYSAWAFWKFRNGLSGIQTNIEKLVDHELEKDHPLADAGWKIDTLRALFDPHVELESYGRNGSEPFCCDCDQYPRYVIVQPYWLHILDQIKRRIIPALPSSINPSTDRSDTLHLASPANQGMQASTETVNAECENILLPDLVSAESQLESSTDDGHTSELITSDYVYRKHDFLCMNCWLAFKKTGRRYSRRRLRNQLSRIKVLEDVEDPEDEFSPYLFNT